MADITKVHKVLGGFFHVVAQLLAGVFSILFVVTAVFVLLLISIDQALLSPETYKRALAGQAIYERIPALVAEQLGAFETFVSDPCAENPLVCRIDGASPELQACLTDVLGQEALVDLGTFKRSPTEGELQLAQPCLDQYGRRPTKDSALAAASPESQACVREALGEEVFDTLLNDERPPTDGEIREMTLCSDQPGGNSDGSGFGGDSMAFMNNLSPGDWERLIGTLLPPDDLRAMSEQALDQVFAFLDGDTDSAKVSLSAMRDRLTGQAGADVIEILLAAQPPCTEAQLVQLAADVSGGEGDLVLCQPQGEDHGPLMFVMRTRWNALVAEMPDEAEIMKPPSPSSPANGGGPLGDDPLAALRYLHQGVWFSLLIPLGPLLLVTVFGVRSRKGWLRWWGVPMFIAGLLTVGLGIAAVPTLDWAWIGYIADKIPPMFSTSLSEVAHELANAVVRELSQVIVLGAGAVGLIGLGAIVSSFFVRARTMDAAPLQKLS